MTAFVIFLINCFLPVFLFLRKWNPDDFVSRSVASSYKAVKRFSRRLKPREPRIVEMDINPRAFFTSRRHKPWKK